MLIWKEIVVRRYAIVLPPSDCYMKDGLFTVKDHPLPMIFIFNIILLDS